MLCSKVWSSLPVMPSPLITSEVLFLLFLGINTLNGQPVAIKFVSSGSSSKLRVEQEDLNAKSVIFSSGTQKIGRSPAAR